MNKFKAVSIHFSISLIVILMISMLVKVCWFNEPFFSLMAVGNLFLLFLLVGLISGPLLTFFIFKENKEKFSLITDLVVIVIVQILGVGYGLFVMSYARPVALVFEVDRIRVLSFAELDRQEESIFPRWTKVWSFSQPQLVFLKPAGNSDEKWRRVYADINGQQASRQPSQWIGYYENSKIVLERSKSIDKLIEKFPERTQEIEFAVGNNIRARWLPLVSEKKLDWVIFLNEENAMPVAYVNLDGFLH